MKMVHLALGFVIIMAVVSIFAAPVGAGPMDPSGASGNPGAPHQGLIELTEYDLDILEQQGYDVTDIRTLLWNGDSEGAASLLNNLLEEQKQ
ncbi:MAG: hypothetical protein ABFC24_12725 [Methanoregulaceae archaeon]